MLKVLTEEGILWLMRVWQVVRKYGKTPRDWHTDVISPIFKKGDRKQCTNYRDITLLCQKKYMPNALKKMVRNSEIKTGGWPEGFSYATPHTRSSLWSKSLRNQDWEYGKHLFACFVDQIEKAYDQILRDNLWKVCGSMALIVSCYAPLNHSTADWKFVFE